MAEGLTDIIEDDGDDVGILFSAQDDGVLLCCQFVPRLATLKMMMKKSQTMRKMEICLTKVWKMENILTDIKKLAEYKVNS